MAEIGIYVSLCELVHVVMHYLYYNIYLLNIAVLICVRIIVLLKCILSIMCTSGMLCMHECRLESD